MTSPDARSCAVSCGEPHLTCYALVLSAMLMAGCASPAKQVLTSANNYRWHHARHAEACPAAPDCAERGRLLNRWWKYLDEAETAITKGGDMPLQIKSLKSVEKEARKWEK